MTTLATRTEVKAATPARASQQAEITQFGAAWTIIRRELLTRMKNQTIVMATIVLAVFAGVGAGVGGWFLVNTYRGTGTVPLNTGLIFAMAMITALMTALVYSSQTLSLGVVEEKSSRIVEILLTKIGVGPLLAGKMIGVGLVTFAQLLVVGGAVVAGFSVVGGWSVLNIEFGPSLLWFLIWFLQGFITFATLSTLLASTVSRQEVLLIVSLYVVPYRLDALWVKVISYLPLFSSYVMPVRFATHSVSTLEIVIAAVIAAAAVPLLFRLTTRIYRNNALRTGSRVSFRKSMTSDDLA